MNVKSRPWARRACRDLATEFHVITLLWTNISGKVSANYSSYSEGAKKKKKPSEVFKRRRTDRDEGDFILF